MPPIVSYYGDHDRVLTGNSLGAFWNSKRNSPDVDAQGFLLEVTESKEVAWSLKVFGNNTQKKGDNDHGWVRVVCGVWCVLPSRRLSWIYRRILTRV